MKIKWLRSFKKNILLNVAQSKSETENSVGKKSKIY